MIAWGQWDSWQSTIAALKLKLQAAFPWQCWDIAQCFVIMFEEPPPSCSNFQLTVVSFQTNGDCKHPANRVRKPGRTITHGSVAGNSLEKRLYVTTSHSFSAVCLNSFTLVVTLMVWLEPWGKMARGEWLMWWEWKEQVNTWQQHDSGTQIIQNYLHMLFTYNSIIIVYHFKLKMWNFNFYFLVIFTSECLPANIFLQL